MNISRLYDGGLQRVFRFGASGVASTVAYFAFVNIFSLLLALEPVFASVAGYLCSLLFSYILQTRFTFRLNAYNHKQFARFLLTSALGLAVSYWGVSLITENFGQSYLAGAAFVCIVLPVVNYILYSIWVFAGADEKSTETPG